MSLDDERFETYLKQFRPLVPEPLPAMHRQPPRPVTANGSWVVAGGILILVAVAMLMRPSDIDVSRQVGVPASRAQLASPPPLTMRSANALLASSPSLNEAFDNIAFRRRSVSLPEGKQSAVAVLGKENFKL